MVDMIPDLRSDVLGLRGFRDSAAAPAGLGFFERLTQGRRACGALTLGYMPLPLRGTQLPKDSLFSGGAATSDLRGTGFRGEYLNIRLACDQSPLCKLATGLLTKLGKLLLLLVSKLH